MHKPSSKGVGYTKCVIAIENEKGFFLLAIYCYNNPEDKRRISSFECNVFQLQTNFLVSAARYHLEIVEMVSCGRNKKISL